MDDSSQYLVLWPDETRGFGDGPSSYIPTLGAATSAVDQYRTVAVHSTNLPTLGAAFTDVSAAAALARVAEGGITDVAQLEAAETALQALLLHDIVHVLVAGPKVKADNGLIHYVRKDSEHRTKLAFDLFSLASSRDWLIAPELLQVGDSRVVHSTLPKSPLIGKTIDELSAQSNYLHEDVSDALNVVIESHGVPAYLTEPTLVRSRRGDGFSKRFYHRLRLSWNDAVGDIPPVHCTFSLPPLLAVVLNRLNNRSDLLSVLRELREELQSVRVELRELNNLVTASTSDSEVKARVQHITDSFDAIVPEARLSDAQRRRRKLLTIQGLVRPVIKHALGFLMNGGVSFDEGLRVAGGMQQMVFESRALVDRTITASTFVDLVKVETLQSLVKYHLSESEIAAIERSIRLRDSR